MKCPVCNQKMRAASKRANDLSNFYCKKCQLRHCKYDGPNRFYYIIKRLFIDYRSDKHTSTITDFNDSNYCWTYAGLIDYIDIEFLKLKCKKLRLFS